MLKMLRAAWARWKRVAHLIGDFQARLLLSMFYFLILAPFALGLKLLADPLQLQADGLGWSTRPSVGDCTEQARRQY
jgi:hypothetical protein